MGKLHLIGGKIWDRDKFVTNIETVFDVNEGDSAVSLGEDDLITPGLIDTGGK